MDTTNAANSGLHLSMAKITDLVLQYAPKVILAILTLVVGIWVINKFGHVVRKLMDKSGMDVSLSPFLVKLVTVGLKLVLLISVASMVGIQTTSLVAVLGAASLAVGLALQGSLANFAGGVMILVLKPYKVGEVVKLTDFVGKVKEIEIFTTVLQTKEGEMIFIPNGSISNSSIVNYTRIGRREVEVDITVRSRLDFGRLEEAILTEARKVPNVMQDPEPEITVEEINPIRTKIRLHAHALPEHFIDVQEQLLGASKIVLQRMEREGRQGGSGPLRKAG